MGLFVAAISLVSVGKKKNMKKKAFAEKKKLSEKKNGVRETK